MTKFNATAMDITRVAPRLAPTGLPFQGRGVSAGSLGGTRLRGLRGHFSRDAIAIALEHDSRSGAASV